MPKDEEIIDTERKEDREDRKTDRKMEDKNEGKEKTTKLARTTTHFFAYAYTTNT